MVEEVANHNARDLHVISLFFHRINLVMVAERLAELVKGTLVNIVVGIVLDQPMKAVKSVDSASNSLWRCLSSEDSRAQFL